MTSEPVTREPPCVDPEALLCALVLAPRTFPRNRFFGLFEDPTNRRIQRRAKRVRGIIRQLIGHGQPAAEVTGELVLDDRVLLRYHVPELNYERTTSLTPLEAALVQYALGRAINRSPEGEPTERVERALKRLEPPLELGKLPLSSLLPGAPLPTSPNL
jgi:hypothetical protein